MHFSFTS
ncbi:hypothetical protein Nmel_012111 [Mimus melanotis]